VLTLTPVAGLAGDGDDGVAGADRVAAVVNDHTGPVVEPAVFVATICQKYVLLVASVGKYAALVNPVATCGGGFVVPKYN